ncbi:MAG: nucleotidyltransferase domain-containing protein [Pirellulaceae bacterium]|nr:nucleotidyltransferase domain-containing protein [Pirellulaceae bacterium]
MLPIIENSRGELEKLCQLHHVGRLELFGSATSVEFDPAGSDLDFLVEFAPLSPSQKADAYFGLLHGLEDLLQRKIDLVTVEAVKNRRFERSIAAQRTLLYAT